MRTDIGELRRLIKVYKDELKAHESGVMMYSAEATHGAIWCQRFLQDLETLQDLHDREGERSP